MHGLTVGAGLRGSSGVPLSFLGDHPVYLNQGEVPIGGRGAAGRTPSASQLDMHLDYPIGLGSHGGHEYSLKLAMDMFNVTNSQFETEPRAVHAACLACGWRYPADRHRLRPADQLPGPVLRPWIGPVRVLADNRIFYTRGGRPPAFLL